MLKRSVTKLGTQGQSAEPRPIAKVKKDLVLRRRAAKRALIDARKERNAIEHILTLPAIGESIHLVVDGRFEPCDLIPAFRRLSHPAVIEQLHITTLGYNSDNIATLANGLDQGKISQVTLVCSTYFKSAEQALFEFARQELQSRTGRVYGLRTHSKLILMKMTNGITSRSKDRGTCAPAARWSNSALPMIGTCGNSTSAG